VLQTQPPVILGNGRDFGVAFGVAFGLTSRDLVSITDVCGESDVDGFADVDLAVEVVDSEGDGTSAPGSCVDILSTWIQMYCRSVRV
jgi:hypothetical protein